MPATKKHPSPTSNPRQSKSDLKLTEPELVSLLERLTQLTEELTGDNNTQGAARTLQNQAEKNVVLFLEAAAGIIIGTSENTKNGSRRENIALRTKLNVNNIISACSKAIKEYEPTKAHYESNALVQNYQKEYTLIRDFEETIQKETTPLALSTAMILSTHTKAADEDERSLTSPFPSPEQAGMSAKHAIPADKYVASTFEELSDGTLAFFSTTQAGAKRKADDNGGQHPPTRVTRSASQSGM